MQAVLGSSPWSAAPKRPPPVKKQLGPLYVLLIGSTGAGKSTLVNTLVNHYRAPVECQKRLPQRSELLVAIPTAHLEANQPEASAARERCVKNRKSWCQPSHTAPMTCSSGATKTATESLNLGGLTFRPGVAVD